jgi:hypothetical protein
MCIWPSLILYLGLGAVLIDRIAIVVDEEVIKESDIRERIRLEAFLSGRKLDFSPPIQRDVAHELIDEAVLRWELKSGFYDVPDESAVQERLDSIRQQFADEDAYRRRLADYEINEKMLEEHLRFQIAVREFIQLRFGNPFAEQSAIERANTEERFRLWLADRQRDLRIDYKDETLL